MLGERLAVNHASAGGEITWTIPSTLGPLTEAETAALEMLGDDEFRYWVHRGWCAVYQ
jgi:hypothetical protein